MTHKNNAATIIKNFPDRGNGRFYPCVIVISNFSFNGTLKSTRINAL
jgi:hypothetical protein